jgi:hypothetical protein
MLQAPGSIERGIRHRPEPTSKPGCCRDWVCAAALTAATSSTTDQAVEESAGFSPKVLNERSSLFYAYH